MTAPTRDQAGQLRAGTLRPDGWQETVTYTVSYVNPDGAGPVTRRVGPLRAPVEASDDRTRAIWAANRMQDEADRKGWDQFYIVRREWRAERDGRVLGGSSVIHTTTPRRDRRVVLGAVLSW